MKILPKAEEEWIAVILLPAKVVFACSSVLLTFHLYPRDSSAAFDVLSGFSFPILLLGAIAQCFICPGAKPERTIIFVGIFSSGFIFGPSAFLVLLCAWPIIRFMRSYERRSPIQDAAVRCVACHEPISIGEDSCRKCGWTYRA